MAKNYIPEIARMLGVEIGEEFWIRDITDGEKFGSLYRFVDGQRRLDFNDGYGWHMDGEDSISDLLFSHFEIVKKPWKPKDKETFCKWVYGQYGKMHVYDDFWSGCYTDLILYRLGNCYRTREEAEADREKWERFYASDERIPWEENDNG